MLIWRISVSESNLGEVEERLLVNKPSWKDILDFMSEDAYLRSEKWHLEKHLDQPIEDYLKISLGPFKWLNVYSLVVREN